MKTPLEIEQKYRVASLKSIRERLERWSCRQLPLEQHCDRYLAHPCRDFASTGEALRIRQVNGRSMMTYKGPRRIGAVKIRPEIEVPFVDQTSEAWSQIWQELGFRVVAEVRKERTPFELDYQACAITVMLDEVELLGSFVELEILVEDTAAIDAAQTTILEVAKSLNLADVEPRSYLRQLLELPSYASTRDQT